MIAKLRRLIICSSSLDILHQRPGSPPGQQPGLGQQLILRQLRGGAGVQVPERGGGAGGDGAVAGERETPQHGHRAQPHQRRLVSRRTGGQIPQRPRRVRHHRQRGGPDNIL